MNIKELAKKNLSEELIADYKPFTMVDGEGFRCSLYVSGCVFNCKNCFNKSIQNFSSGILYNQELEDKIVKDLEKPYVKGLTLLGGDPMLNTSVCVKLIKRVRSEYGNTKDIWCWTGYTWEELQESISCQTRNSINQNFMLHSIDVLIDGRYVDELRDKTGKLKFRGSSNQRIIDVKKSLAQGQVVILEGMD